MEGNFKAINYEFRPIWDDINQHLAQIMVEKSRLDGKFRLNNVNGFFTPSINHLEKISSEGRPTNVCH